MTQISLFVAFVVGNYLLKFFRFDGCVNMLNYKMSLESLAKLVFIFSQILFLASGKITKNISID